MVYEIKDFARGMVNVYQGRNGLKDLIVPRRAIGRVSTGQVKLLPRRRRIGKLGPAKVLELRSEP